MAWFLTLSKALRLLRFAQSLRAFASACMFSDWLAMSEGALARRVEWLREPARNPKYELPPAIIAFPFSRWGAQPFVAHPFPCPIDAYEQAIRSNKPDFPLPKPGKNLILTALAWQDALNADPTMTKAGIARKNAISRARVTQIINLLDLPKEIVIRLQGLKTPNELRFFSGNRLHAILACKSSVSRLNAFNKIWYQYHQAAVMSSK